MKFDNKGYFWKLHVQLLDFVDLVDDKELAAKLKTKILDVAHEVRQELDKCSNCQPCDKCDKHEN